MYQIGYDIRKLWVMPSPTKVVVCVGLMFSNTISQHDTTGLRHEHDIIHKEHETNNIKKNTFFFIFIS